MERYWLLLTIGTQYCHNSFSIIILLLTAAWLAQLVRASVFCMGGQNCYIRTPFSFSSSFFSTGIVINCYHYHLRQHHRYQQHHHHHRYPRYHSNHLQCHDYDRPQNLYQNYNFHPLMIRSSFFFFFFSSGASGRV